LARWLLGLPSEPPFTPIAISGPESLVPDADVDPLIAAIRTVRATRASKRASDRVALKRYEPRALSLEHADANAEPSARRGLTREPASDQR